MLLAPQIMLNRFPTVQSNKSISRVMEEVDLWAIHGLYLIVTANPRFKASPSLTQSQEQPVPLLGAVPATAQNPCSGEVSGWGNTHTTICRVTACTHIYMIYVYTYVTDKLQQNCNQMKRQIHDELFLGIYQLPTLLKGDAHMHNSPYLYCMPRLFSSSLFRTPAYSRRNLNNLPLKIKWKLLKFYA